MNYTGILTEELSCFKESIFRLRYMVLVEEQGKHPRYADHNTRNVAEPLDQAGVMLVKIIGGQLIGAARINRFRDIKDPYYLNAYTADFFTGNGIENYMVIISRLVLLPGYRGSASFYGIICEMYRWILQSGYSVILIECAADQEPIFKKMGFVSFNDPFLHLDGMIVQPMILDCNNRERIKRMGSILDKIYPPDFVCIPDIPNIISILISGIS